MQKMETEFPADGEGLDVTMLLDVGRRCLADGDLSGALRAAQAAYDRQKMNLHVWALLEEIAMQQADYFMAGFWMGLRARKCGTAIFWPDVPGAKEDIFRGVGWASSPAWGAPYMIQPEEDEKSGEIRQKMVVLGRHLPDEMTGRKGYFVGLYNPQNKRNARALLLDGCLARHASAVEYGDMTYDLMHAKLVQNRILSTRQGHLYIQPLAGAGWNQSLLVSTASGVQGTITLPKYETVFLRVDEPVRLSADAPFWLGEPIPLRHSPKRRKVVLNILADGFSWGEQKKEGGRNIPNILRFFGEGMIFDHAFSGSEYTYPSLATLETGLLPTTSHIFSDDWLERLGPSYRTLSEQMKGLGYYCVNLMSDGEGIYNGVTRGYDRMLVNRCIQPAYQAVPRTVRQLEAFHETDQFLFVHISDSHPYNDNIRWLESVQTQLEIKDALDEEEQTSVFLRPTHRNQMLNQQNIRDMDRQLGMLFDYLTSHYEDDEFLVCLYSDHGCSIYSDQPWLLNYMQSNSTLMVRGGGIPRGVHADELMSTADLYAILGHVCGFPLDDPRLDTNLPEILGGKRRNLAISQSIYSGQTRKICLRTERYACRFETEALTEEDGSVDASRYTLHVFFREGEEHEECLDPAVKDRFLRYLACHAGKLMLKGLQKA